MAAGLLGRPAADPRGEDLKWQVPDRLRAIRLLGRQPMDLLTDERVLMIYLACDAMDPTAPTSLHDMMTETDDEDLERIKEGVRGRGAGRKKPDSPEAGRAALLSLVEHVANRLEVKLSVHRERQEFEKAVQWDLLAFDDSKEGELMRRYQLAKDREMHRAINAVFKVRKETPASAGCELPVVGCADGDADLPALPVELTIGRDDESHPDPLESALESRLQAVDGSPIPADAATPTIPPLQSCVQAAGGLPIPAEAGTPTIHAQEAGLQAEIGIGTGDETKPSPPEGLVDETKPNPAKPPIPAGGLLTVPEYVAAVLGERTRPIHTRRCSSRPSECRRGSRCPEPSFLHGCMSVVRGAGSVFVRKLAAGNRAPAIRPSRRGMPFPRETVE